MQRRVLVLLISASVGCAEEPSSQHHGMRGKEDGGEMSEAVAVDPGVHLALGKEGEITITFSTPSIGAAAWVKYGSSSDTLTSSAAASSVTLANNGGAGVGWRNISINTATISNITYRQQLFYKTSASATVFNFTCTVPRGLPQKPVKFAIFGDLGIKEQDGANWTLYRLKQHLEQEPALGGGFDAVLHVGDIAYDLEENAGKTGDEFLADMEPVASKVPYMTCPGNHERDCVGCSNPPYTNYRARFPMPLPQTEGRTNAAAADPMYWSMDMGAVHVISLNTDVFLLGAGMAAEQYSGLVAQLAWLEEDLKAAAANRAQVPWIVAFGHEMMYSSHDSGHRAQAAVLRDGGSIANGSKFAGLEPLFHNYSVDLYFAGHEHVYEHFARINKGAPCNKDSAGTACGLQPGRPEGCPCTAHLIVGNAGNREFPYHEKNGSLAPFAYPLPSYERFRSPYPAGFGFLTVHNSSVMTWQQFNARTGAVLDEHTYIR